MPTRSKSSPSKKKVAKKKVTKKKTVQKKNGPAKGEGGRPVKYDPSYCQQLIDHMGRGYSFESFAGVICVAISTIYQWVKKYPDFSNARKKGEAACRVFWEKKGIDYLFHSRGGVFNSTVWIFNMKNRFHWRDQPEFMDEDIDGVEFVA